MALPHAQFISGIEKFCEAKNVDELINELYQHYRAYKAAIINLSQRKNRTMQKISELKGNLEMAKFMLAWEKWEDLILDFEIIGGMYGRAKLTECKRLYFWIGGHVMVEFSIDQAKDFLEANLKRAKANLEIVSKELQHIKDQITITEVSIARLYNFEIHRRRQKRER